MKQTINGFRESKDINNSTATKNSTSNNNKNPVINNKENNSKSNKNVIIEADGVESFPNMRSFQKELLQKIYSKESGEILQILRMNNESLKSSKIGVYENIGDISNVHNNSNSNVNSSVIKNSNLAAVNVISNKNLYLESGKIENTDSDYFQYMPSNNINLSNFEKISLDLKNQKDKSPNKGKESSYTNGNPSSKNVLNHINNLNNSNEEINIDGSSNNNNNKNSKPNEEEINITNFQPEITAFKVKHKKKKLETELRIMQSREKSSNDPSTELLLKTRESVSDNSQISNDFNLFSKKNSFNPPLNLLSKRNSNLINNINTNYNKANVDKDSNDKFNIYSKTYHNNNNPGEFQLYEKSVYLTQSSRNIFPKISNQLSNKKLKSLKAFSNSNSEVAANKSIEISSNNNDNNNKINNPREGKISNLTNYNNGYNNLNEVYSPKLGSNKGIYNANNNNNNNERHLNQYNYVNSSNNNTLNSINKALYKQGNKFFCPHCEHCNVIKDENLEKYFNMKEAKNIVRKSLDFIVTNYQTDQSYLDFLLGNKDPGLNYLNFFSNHGSLQQINTNNNLHLNNAEYENIKNLKNRTKFDVDVLLNTYPKHSNNRTVLQLVTHFLDALINDKVSLDSIAGPETFEKLKESLISQGIAFKENEGEIEFDKELDMIFDETTKEKLRKLFKKKFMNMKKSEEESTIKSDDQMVQSRKRFMLLFLIFIQILSEIGSECKEKAVLLYRVFKLFFVEQEKKWTVITNHMKEKIYYYKELAKTVIQQKNKHLAKIETINDCLFANKLSLENLQRHKNLIKDLLNVVNEKRDQIYLLTSENEILSKELNFWVHDFEKLKLDNGIRDKLKELNIQKMVQNVNDEMSHKQVPESEKLLLINADRFLIASGHRNYFYDQKNYYLNEIARITELYENSKFKKKSYKRSLKDMQAQMEREMERLTKDIQYFREKLACEKKDTLVQTDIDDFGFKRIIKNHNLITFQKRMAFNKLTDFIEKIRFGCSRHKPISKKSVLNFIPEIYHEKQEQDSRLDIEGKMKTTMDEFFLKFIKEKFKMTKIIKRNCEQMLMSIIKYSPEDNRIDLLRKFLGIGEDRIKREVLDCYLIVLKNLPISFYKIFEESENNYLMTLENCMEIYLNKFPYFSINIDALDRLLRLCFVIQNEKECENLGLESKKDIFYLMKYYNKQNASFQLLLNSFKNKLKNEESYLTIADNIMIANKDYDLNLVSTLDLLKRNFNLVSDKIQLDSFLDYFVNKYVFKIKITDFVQVSIESFSDIYADLDRIAQKLWQKADAKKNGIIFYKEFESVMTELLGNSENKWKISEYFKNACDSADKDFLLKDEFIAYCLNTKDILFILIDYRKKHIKR